MNGNILILRVNTTATLVHTDRPTESAIKSYHHIDGLSTADKTSTHTHMCNKGTRVGPYGHVYIVHKQTWHSL